MARRGFDRKPVFQEGEFLVMNVLILGMDGYIGWSLALHLASRGHKVAGVDNFSRRANVNSVQADSATPILHMNRRLEAAHKILGKTFAFYEGDLVHYAFLKRVMNQVQPQAIVHLGEQPSAPFSMIDHDHAIYTQRNNVEGTWNVLFAMRDLAPDAHLIKLGTMGEYGTPNVRIPEGFFEIEYRGRKDLLPFPKQPGSIYHLTKVHDSANVDFACRVWKLRSTDVMQGVVYGTRTPEMVDDSLLTRFDFDECFGTVINRFCAQTVIGHPLTPYGLGHQKRGFIDLVDSVQCLTIAVEKPADRGQYRVFNQLDEVYGVTELAHAVADAGIKVGLDPIIQATSNPRFEKEEHYYSVEHDHLRNLGFKPTRTLAETLHVILTDLIRFKERIMAKKDAILPKTRWVPDTKTEQQVAEIMIDRLGGSSQLPAVDSFHRQTAFRQCILNGFLSLDLG
jgi:UDP-sulfoquinovose synthase